MLHLKQIYSGISILTPKKAKRLVVTIYKIVGNPVSQQQNASTLTVFYIMEVFKETFEFGIQLTYLHPLDTAALALHSLSTPDPPPPSPQADGANTLHYEMMMLIF